MLEERDMRGRITVENNQATIIPRAKRKSTIRWRSVLPDQLALVIARAIAEVEARAGRLALRQQSFRLVTEMRQIETASGRGGSEDHAQRYMARNCESVQHSSMASNPYFINLVNRIIRDRGSRAGMDALSQRSVVLLRMIGESEALDQPLRVHELIEISRLGTPPTIYSSVAELAEGGWIDRHVDEDDGRATRLHLTAKSRRAFAEMSRQIERMAKA